MTATERWYSANLQLLAYLLPQCLIRYDDEDATWIAFEHFPLPSNFQQGESDLLLLLPGLDQPVTVMPRHFYIDQDLRSRSGRSPGHIFEQHGKPSRYGYAWFCLHLRNWNPTPDVISGDNLATVVNTIYHMLAGL